MVEGMQSDNIAKSPSYWCLNSQNNHAKFEEHFTTNSEYIYGRENAQHLNINEKSLKIW